MTWYLKEFGINKTSSDFGYEDGLKHAADVLFAQRAILRMGSRQMQSPDLEFILRLLTINDLKRLDALLTRIFEMTSWEELLRNE